MESCNPVTTAGSDESGQKSEQRKSTGNRRREILARHVDRLRPADTASSSLSPLDVDRLTSEISSFSRVSMMDTDLCLDLKGRASTADHSALCTWTTFHRKIFEPLAGSNLITVPCCKSCNSSASKDDQYFLVFIGLREGANRLSKAFNAFTGGIESDQ